MPYAVCRSNGGGAGQVRSSTGPATCVLVHCCTAHARCDVVLRRCCVNTKNRIGVLGTPLTSPFTLCQVHRHHPPLVYGRTMSEVPEESVGVALCMVEDTPSGKPVYALITYKWVAVRVCLSVWAACAWRAFPACAPARAASHPVLHCWGRCGGTGGGCVLCCGHGHGHFLQAVVCALSLRRVPVVAFGGAQGNGGRPRCLPTAQNVGWSEHTQLRSVCGCHHLSLYAG